MRILHVIDRLNTGGVQKLVLQLTSSQILKGYDHTVICLTTSAGEMLRDFQSVGIQVLTCPIIVPSRGMRPYRLWNLARRAYSIWGTLKLTRLFSKLEADVIHSQNSGALISQLLAARNANVPFILTIQGQVKFTPFEQVVLKWLIRRSQKQRITFTAVSASSASCLTETILQVEEHPIHLIPNAVDLEKIQKPCRSRTSMRATLGVHSNGELIIGSVGRLQSEKGYDIMIEAAALCAPNIPKANFVIAGDGKQESTLETRISALGLRDRIRLIGLYKDVPELLSAFDIYVQPSREEGLPLATIEAMAAGLPIIATTAGGLPELLKQGHAGLLVPVGDARALAEAICQAASDIDLRSKLAQEASKRSEEFSTKKVAQLYANLYQSVISQ